MTTLNTSVTVSFDGSSSGDGNELFSAEVDSRDDGYNHGKTSFLKGDSPVVLLYASANVVLTKLLQSEGTYTALGWGTHEVEEDLTFANTRVATFGKPYLSGLQLTETMPAIPSWKIYNNGLLLPTNMVGVAKVKYTTWFYAYRITNVSGDFPVVVYFEGKTT